MNKYFNVVAKGRNKIDDWMYPSSEIRILYNTLEVFWKNNSPSYSDIMEIICFVKYLESAYFYPNKRGCTYAVVNERQYKCPLTVSITSSASEIEMQSGFLWGVYNSRYIIRITLSHTKDTNWIEISILETESKKTMSKIKFEDGQYKMKGEEFEEQLFITIVDTLYYSTKELIDIYSGKKEKEQGIQVSDKILQNIEHNNDEKGVTTFTKCVRYFKHLWSGRGQTV
jgi:hypothetical protein